MNIEHDLGGDYRELAGRLGMTNDDIILLSQRKNATESILVWAERKAENTVGKLRKIFVEMERDDCVGIIDKSYESA